MQKTKAISIYLTIGLLIAGSAIFAKQLGLDPSVGLGKGRIALLILGILIAVFPWLPRRKSVDDDTTGTDLFLFPVLLAVLVIYFGFASINSDASSRYYSLLATSFRRGELSLPLRPDPELLALPNPYDPATRQGVKVPMDLSLYKGKFYLYWGPAPSLLLAMVLPYLPEKIGDLYILFFSMCGIFLSEFLLIRALWQCFFPALPKWMLSLSIALAGLANPALWLLGQPKLYEAAIAAAQFFFISGLLAAVLALGRPYASRSVLLMLAGTLWALAVGTRLVMVFPVVFMTLMVIYWFFKNHGRSLPSVLTGLIPLAVPLFAGAASLAWYNWARFGSIVETGFTYQLAGPYLQKHMHELFLPAYIFQNLYNYTLHPFSVNSAFPFLHPIRGITRAILPWQTLPRFYLSQLITGFQCAVPFTVFAGIPIIAAVRQLFRKNRAAQTSPDSPVPSLDWITTSLIGSFALAFLSLLSFFWAAMRYAEDFMPELMLLSIVGFWQGYQLLLGRSPGRGKMYALLGAVLAVLSITTAILLALSLHSSSALL